MKKRKKYWIKFYHGECPVCGRDKSYRQRQYSRKPKDIRKRHVELPQSYTYDWCDI